MPRTPNLPTPVLVVVGAGDLAVEKLRGARAEAQRRAAARNVSAALRELPADAQARLNAALNQAAGAYDDLAGRGQSLVARISGQQSTEDLQRHADIAGQKASTTRRSADSTVTSARRTAEAAGQAARDAADKVGD